MCPPPPPSTVVFSPPHFGLVQLQSVLFSFVLCNPAVFSIAISLQIWQLWNSDSLPKVHSCTVKLPLVGNASPSCCQLLMSENCITCLFLSLQLLFYFSAGWCWVIPFPHNHSTFSAILQHTFTYSSYHTVTTAQSFSSGWSVVPAHSCLFSPLSWLSYLLDPTSLYIQSVLCNGLLPFPMFPSAEKW